MTGEDRRLPAIDSLPRKWKLGGQAQKQDMQIEDKCFQNKAWNQDKENSNERMPIT